MNKPYGEVNVELFQKVKEKILEEPRRFDMSRWGKYFPQWARDTSEDYPPCGTVACIAGWALFLDAEQPAAGFNFCNPAAAAEVLGLPPERRNEIFHVRNWPDSFRQRHDNAKSPAERAQAAAEFIDYVCGIKPV